MKYFYILFLFFISYQLQAQKYDYNWVIGYDTLANTKGGTLIDFNFKPRKISFFPKIASMWSAVASMSDKDGNLMFYSNGCFLYNAKHEKIKNGNGPQGDFFFNAYCKNVSEYDASAPFAQSMLCIPHTDSSRIFYLFSNNGLFVSEAISSYVSYGMLLQKIDMSKNNSDGEVTAKKNLIIKDTLMLGGLDAVKHSNGKYWWIISKQDSSNCFWLTLFDGKGNILKQFTQCLGNNALLKDGAGFHVKFSPDGNKFIISTGSYQGEKLPWKNAIHIYDFDRCTGMLSNYKSLEFKDTLNLFPFFSISPNGRFLYLTPTLYAYQYDLQAKDIEKSKILVADYDGFVDIFPARFLINQLAPDGKIYIGTGSSTSYYHVINNPDSLGLKCDFRQHAIKLASYNFWSVPTYPNYRLAASNENCIVVSTKENERIDVTWRIRISPNPTSSATILEDINEDNSQWKTAIFDLQGRLITHFIWKSTINIDVSQFLKGIYILKSENQNGNNFTIGKLIVE